MLRTTPVNPTKSNAWRSARSHPCVISLPVRKLLLRDWPDIPTCQHKGRLRILDYGCGFGDDAYELNKIPGYDVSAYDPYFRPDKTRKILKRQYDIVLCTYVLNVVKYRGERQAILERIRARLRAKRGVAYITVRRGMKMGDRKNGSWQGDVRLMLPEVFDNSQYTTYILHAHRCELPMRFEELQYV